MSQTCDKRVLCLQCLVISCWLGKHLAETCYVYAMSMLSLQCLVISRWATLDMRHSIKTCFTQYVGVRERAPYKGPLSHPLTLYYPVNAGMGLKARKWTW